MFAGSELAVTRHAARFRYVLDILPIEAGAFYVMDRGYLDFTRLYRMHQVGAFFVTRSKRGMDARRVYSASTDRTTGVICDQRIALNGFYAHKHYPEQLRRIRFKDPESGKTLVFLTNNTTLPPLTVAALYKSRGQVELFFKWIKQHLRIKKFLGTSENAVKTQIWCAVATYVLIAIVRKELQLDASLYTLLQILSVCVFEKIPLNKAFLDASDRTDQRRHALLVDGGLGAGVDVAYAEVLPGLLQRQMQHVLVLGNEDRFRFAADLDAALRRLQHRDPHLRAMQHARETIRMEPCMPNTRMLTGIFRAENQSPAPAAARCRCCSPWRARPAPQCFAQRPHVLQQRRTQARGA